MIHQQHVTVPQVDKQDTATQAFQTKESPRLASRLDKEHAALEQVGHARAALAIAGRGGTGLLRHLRASMTSPGGPAFCKPSIAESGAALCKPSTRKGIGWRASLFVVGGQAFLCWGGSKEHLCV